MRRALVATSAGRACRTPSLLVSPRAPLVSSAESFVHSTTLSEALSAQTLVRISLPLSHGGPICDFGSSLSFLSWQISSLLRHRFSLTLLFCYFIRPGASSKTPLVFTPSFYRFFNYSSFLTQLGEQYLPLRCTFFSLDFGFGIDLPGHLPTRRLFFSVTILDSNSFFD